MDNRNNNLAKVIPFPIEKVRKKKRVKIAVRLVMALILLLIAFVTFVAVTR